MGNGRDTNTEDARGNKNQLKLKEIVAGEPVSRIVVLVLQINNLRGINERFVFCDLWRTAFLTEENTSDMFLSWWPGTVGTKLAIELSPQNHEVPALVLRGCPTHRVWHHISGKRTSKPTRFCSVRQSHDREPDDIWHTQTLRSLSRS